MPRVGKGFHVTDIREKQKGLINPVMVTFQNGEVNNGSDFNVTFSAKENGDTNVEVKSSSGDVFIDSSKYEKPVKTQVILIRNRKTNKVKLIEIDCALLIHKALLSTPEINKTEVDYAKEVKNLNRAFGGKRIANRIEQREKLQTSSLPIADEVKKAVEDIEVDENTSLNMTEEDSLIDLLPPCHRDAGQPSEVYVMSEVLSEEELEALKNEVNTMEEAKFKPQEYSPFFMDCYAEAKKYQADLNRRLAGLVFIEALIRFLKIASKKLSRKNVILCSFSSVIHEKLLKEFCIRTDTSVTRPQTMRDKALCYIVAVSLICCNYKINMKLLSTSTAVHIRKLSRLARAVGAVPVPREDHYVLKVPLPALPKASFGRGRKNDMLNL